MTQQRLRMSIPLVVLLTANIVLRIPRVSGVIGVDAFQVLWMANVIHEGFFDNWTLTVFSPFGLYTFVKYPIGVPLLLGFMFAFGFSYEFSVLLISILVTIVGVIGSYLLGRHLLDGPHSGLLFALFFSMSPVFYRFSYFTISVRGPFLAILPWFLLYSVRFSRDHGWRNAIASAILLTLLFLTHRLAILIPIYAAIFLAYVIIPQIFNRIRPSCDGIRLKLHSVLDRIHIPLASHHRQQQFLSRMFNSKWVSGVDWTKLLFSLLLLVASYVMGVFLLPIDEGKTTAVFLSNDSFIGITTNLIIDYGLRLGLISIFFPLGVVYSLHTSCRKQTWLLHILLLTSVMFLLPKSLYVSLVFLPTFAYYSVLGLEILLDSSLKRYLGIGCFVIAGMFGIIYNSWVVELPLWMGFIGASAILIIILTLVRRDLWVQKHTLEILLVSVVIFSMVASDGLICQDPYSYMTSEEMAVIDYLEGIDNPGILISYNPRIASRVQSYGFSVIIGSNRGITALYNGWITPEEIIWNTQLNLDPISIISNGQIFQYGGVYPDHTLFNQLVPLVLTNQSDYEKAKSIGLEFVIVEKSFEGYAYTFEFCGDSITSEMLRTVPDVGEMVLECDAFSLYRLP